METVYIYPLATLRKGYARRLREARMEAARVWTLCRDLHLAARQAHTRWPTRDDLQQATKGKFALHSQTVQMVCQQFLANVDTARELRQTNLKIRYPYKDKRYYPRLTACAGRESGTGAHRPGRWDAGANHWCSSSTCQDRLEVASSSGRTATSYMSRFRSVRLQWLQGRSRPRWTWEKFFKLQ